MEEDQIEKWFHYYVDDVYNFLIYYLGHQDVDDIVQEVFIKTLRSKRTGDIRSPKTYLFSIARNTAIDHIRKSKRVNWGIKEEVYRIPSQSSLPESSLLAKEEHNALLEHMKQFKKSYRDVLVLRLINELTFTEISATLGWKESKVKTTYYRAIQKLRNESPMLKEVASR